MFEWFGTFGRRQRAGGAIGDLERKIEQLQRQFDEWSKRQVHVHIEHVHIDRPLLEKLTFSLDKLDIRDLSGSLNLGNNFGIPADSVLKANRRDAGTGGDSGRKPGPTASRGNDRSRPGAGAGKTDNQNAATNFVKTSGGYSVKIGKS